MLPLWPLSISDHFLMEQMDLTISDSAEASKSPSFLWSKWHKSKPKTPLNVRNSKQQTDRSARGTMFKLGFAFVAVALFVCSCYADLLTEELNSLTEHSNGNLKDRGSNSKTTGEDDDSVEDDGSGSGSGDEASGLKQEQGYNRVFFWNFDISLSLLSLRWLDHFLRGSDSV